MMTAEKLGDVLWEAGITATPTFSDAQYELPNLDFIGGSDFRQSVASVMAAFDAIVYTPESNDCDDSADVVWVVAQRLHHRTRAGKAGIALGLLDYFTDSGIWHRINPVIGIPKGQSNPIVVFYDWEKGGVLTTLNRTEINTVNFLLM